MQQRMFVLGTTGAGRARSWFRALAVVGVALIAATLLTGCGAKEKAPEAKAQVSGTVTVQGTPLTFGTVTLLSSGVSWEAKLDKAGKFQIPDALAPGTYLVYLRAVDGGPHPNVPVKYQSDTSTDYTVTVKAGDNNFPIDLK